MKTLDEVIKGMEHCHEDNCMECPYQFEPKDFDCITQCQYTDALHYLKEYRKLDSLDAVAFSEDDNPPLTWDELKQMAGKPVWVEYGTFSDSGWAFISEISEKGSIEFLLPWGLRLVMHEGAIGKTWQAYRKERK